MEPCSIGISRFVPEHRDDAVAEWTPVSAWQEGELEEVPGEDSEDTRPALWWSGRKQGALGISDEFLQASAQGESQERCVEEALGGPTTTARHLLDPVERLELAEQELNLPAQRVHRRHRFQLEHRGWRVGDVESVHTEILAPDGRDSHLDVVHREIPTPDASIRIVDLHVEVLATHQASCVLQSNPVERPVL